MKNNIQPSANQTDPSAPTDQTTQTDQTRQLVSNFIETIWNQRRFDKLDEFIHPGFTDHSLPPSLPTGVEGLQQWIENTGRSFDHTTIIEDQVTEAGKSILKISMQLKHIGQWRDIPATGAEISTIGYRYFRVADNKIIEHWALIDGNSIENQLKNTAHNCKIQQ
jgi:predicted SnoaL-like aldol condensation-catalyzing enzyme